MCLCYLFSAKTAWQLVNQKADHSHNESNRVANWNALPPASYQTDAVRADLMRRGECQDVFRKRMQDSQEQANDDVMQRSPRRS